MEEEEEEEEEVEEEEEEEEGDTRPPDTHPAFPQTPVYKRTQVSNRRSKASIVHPCSTSSKSPPLLGWRAAAKAGYV